MVDFIQNNYFLICSTYNALTISVNLIRLGGCGIKLNQSANSSSLLFIGFLFPSSYINIITNIFNKINFYYNMQDINT